MKTHEELITVRDRKEVQRQNDIMLEGTCPYCKANPAPRWGHPCPECREMLEDEMNTVEVQQIIFRLNHRYRHQAERTW